MAPADQREAGTLRAYSRRSFSIISHARFNRKLVMREKIVPRVIVLLLLVGALILPVAISLLFGLAKLLRAMDDSPGAAALDWISLAAGVLWVLDLVALIVIQTIESLLADDSHNEPPA